MYIVLVKLKLEVDWLGYSPKKRRMQGQLGMIFSAHLLLFTIFWVYLIGLFPTNLISD